MLAQFPVNQLSAHGRSHHGGGPARQRGMAALLLILLTGAALTALSMGMMSYVGGTQSSAVSVHARTQAEINAWSGIEAMRKYLNGKPVSVAAGLGNVNIRNAAGSVIARAVYEPSCSGNGGLSCFLVTGLSEGSSAVLEASFQQSGGGVVPEYLGSTAIINGHFNAAGGMFQVTGNGQQDDLIVDGNIKIGQISPSTVQTCATGSIEIGGQSSFGGSYSAHGDIWVHNTTAHDVSLWAKNIFLGQGAAGTFRSVKYQTTLASNKHHFNQLEGGGNLFADKNNPPTVSGTARIKGEVFQLGTPIEQLCSSQTGGFHCRQPQTTTEKWQLSGLLTAPNTNGDAAPVAPRCQTRIVTHDANQQESQANYIFFFDEKNSMRPTLRLQNLRVKEGAGFRELPAQNYDLTLNQNSMTILPGTAINLVTCWGGSCNLGNRQASTGWGELRGLRLPPGVVLFKSSARSNGNVLISAEGGHFLYNSLLGGGHLVLDSGGDSILRAPNFSIEGQGSQTTAIACKQTIYPAQLCDDRGHLKTWTDHNGQHKGIPIGNVAVLSNLDFRPNGWKIYGNVIVGKKLITGGAQVSIHGGLLIGDNRDQTNEVSQGGLNIDMSGLTQDQGYIVPGSGGTGGGDGAGGGTGGSGSSSAETRLVRVRAG